MIESGAVVHPAFLLELAHPGVDDRIPGASGLPRGEIGLAPSPSLAARPVILRAQSREGGEHLVVEVAPADLAHERFSALPALEPFDELQRGDAAEVQGGADPRRGVGHQVVVQVAVAVQPRSRPATQVLPGIRLTAGGPVGRGLLIGELTKFRDCIGCQPLRHPERVAVPRALRDAAPAATPSSTA